MKGSPAYDLMILIDAEAPDDQRAAIIDDVRKQISGGGALKGDADWGRRKLAYEIDHRPEAHYHLFQFEARSELLNQLNRNLSILDAVVRHRIIKLTKGVPEETPRAPAPRYSEGQSERSGEHGVGEQEETAKEAQELQAVAQPEQAPEQPQPAGTGEPEQQ
jgi:small subunit ribosomal protein S6